MSDDIRHRRGRWARGVRRRVIAFWAGVLALALILTVALVAVTLAAEPVQSIAVTTATPSATAPAAPFGGLPGRSTATPSPAFTPTPTPAVTSPFGLPTLPGDGSGTPSATPTADCRAVFPIESLEAIELGRTTVTQIEAQFGRAEAISGRPTRFRFEAEGCTLWVTPGVQEALELELTDYGTLGWLLDRYDNPAWVGVSEGNLTLLLADQTLLLYPDQGIIAQFDALPDDLMPETIIARLVFRRPFEVEAQVRRLNLRAVEWVPPLVGRDPTPEQTD